MIIDIHTHSFPNSDDSTLDPEQLIDEAKRVGLDGICITDHDGFWSPEDLHRLSRAHDFLALPGCEVTTDEGHLLVYGLRRYVFGMHRASFVKRLVDEVGGAIVVAHPYRRAYSPQADTGPSVRLQMLKQASRNPAFCLADAVEVLNGRGSAKENAFSREVAARFGVPETGASDAHRLGDLGTFATEFHRPIRCLEDLIRELKAGRISPAVLGKRAGILIGRGSSGRPGTDFHDT